MYFEALLNSGLGNARSDQLQKNHIGKYCDPYAQNTNYLKNKISDSIVFYFLYIIYIPI